VFLQWLLIVNNKNKNFFIFCGGGGGWGVIEADFKIS
jgi:hypothetical protein